MKFVRHALTAAALACALLPLSSQAAYPDKPIRLIVPFPPGGGTDVLAREVATKIGTDTGWKFVVENHPGAGGNIGVNVAAQAAPDGYTIVLGQTSNLAINATLYTHLPYDPEKSLTPIGLVAQAPLVLVTGAKSAYKTLADVVGAAKAKPGTLTVATSGIGTVAHLTTVEFQKAAGVKVTHVPYKGAEQGLTDVIGGRVDMYMSSVPTLIGPIRSGMVRALAVTSLKRSDDLPDVPAFSQSYPGFEGITWFGLLGPANLPANVVKTLNDALVKALKSPQIEKQFKSQGAQVDISSPGEFATLIHKDRIRWGELVKESGAHLD